MNGPMTKRLRLEHPLIVARGQARPVKHTGGDELVCKPKTNPKKAKRQITKATFETWQKEHEMKHQTLLWL